MRQRVAAPDTRGKGTSIPYLFCGITLRIAKREGPAISNVFIVMWFSGLTNKLIRQSLIIAFFGTSAVHAVILPPGFTTTEYGGILDGSVTSMDFAPDGRLFVCLQEG